MVLNVFKYKVTETIEETNLLGSILSNSGAKAREFINQHFWDRFCRLLEPMPESH